MMLDWKSVPLEIHIYNAVYPAAAVFKLRDQGIVFIEVGYNLEEVGLGRHVIHAIQGEFSYEEASDAWLCGEAIVRAPSQRVIEEYEAWRRRTPKFTDRDFIRSFIGDGGVATLEELSE